MRHGYGSSLPKGLYTSGILLTLIRDSSASSKWVMCSSAQRDILPCRQSEKATQATPHLESQASTGVIALHSGGLRKQSRDVNSASRR